MRRYVRASTNWWGNVSPAALPTQLQRRRRRSGTNAPQGTVMHSQAVRLLAFVARLEPHIVHSTDLTGDSHRSWRALLACAAIVQLLLAACAQAPTVASPPTSEIG